MFEGVVKYRTKVSGQRQRSLVRTNSFLPRAYHPEGVESMLRKDMAGTFSQPVPAPLLRGQTRRVHFLRFMSEFQKTSGSLDLCVGIAFGTEDGHRERCVGNPTPERGWGTLSRPDGQSSERSSLMAPTLCPKQLYDYPNEVYLNFEEEAK
jgi:hypothetical protein